MTFIAIIILFVVRLISLTHRTSKQDVVKFLAPRFTNNVGDEVEKYHFE